MNQGDEPQKPHWIIIGVVGICFAILIWAAVNVILIVL